MILIPVESDHFTPVQFSFSSRNLLKITAHQPFATTRPNAHLSPVDKSLAADAAISHADKADEI
jgi:hypothetical protein